MSRYDVISPKPKQLYGVEFRSRLETRWAECWVDAGIGEYVYYESDTYMLASNWFYTPDFSIGHAVFEIKPELPTKLEIAKAQALIASGAVPFNNFRFLIGYPCRDEDGGRYGLAEVPHTHTWKKSGDKELRAVLNADGHLCSKFGNLGVPEPRRLRALGVNWWL